MRAALDTSRQALAVAIAERDACRQELAVARTERNGAIDARLADRDAAAVRAAELRMEAVFARKEAEARVRALEEEAARLHAAPHRVATDVAQREEELAALAAARDEALRARESRLEVRERELQARESAYTAAAPAAARAREVELQARLAEATSECQRVRAMLLDAIAAKDAAVGDKLYAESSAAAFRRDTQERDSAIAQQLAQIADALVDREGVAAADEAAAAGCDSAQEEGAAVAASPGGSDSEARGFRSGALPSPPLRAGSVSAERSAYAAAAPRAGAGEPDDAAALSAAAAAEWGGGQPRSARGSARVLSSLPRSGGPPPSPPRGALVVGTKAVVQKTVFMSDFCSPIELDVGAARLSDKQAAEVMVRGFPTLTSKAPADVVVFLAEVEGVVASSYEPEVYTQVSLQQCGRFFLGSASLTHSGFALALSGQDTREIEFFPGMMLHQLLALMQAYCNSYAPPLADLVVHLSPLAPTHLHDRHRKDTRGLLVQIGAIVRRTTQTSVLPASRTLVLWTPNTWDSGRPVGGSGHPEPRVPTLDA